MIEPEVIGKSFTGLLAGKDKIKFRMLKNVLTFLI